MAKFTSPSQALELSNQDVNREQQLKAEAWEVTVKKHTEKVFEALAELSAQNPHWAVFTIKAVGDIITDSMAKEMTYRVNKRLWTMREATSFWYVEYRSRYNDHYFDCAVRQKYGCVWLCMVLWSPF